MHILKSMTFNIRYGSADDKENKWDNRKSLVLDRIKNFAPDLLGLQECRDDFQAEFIKDNLNDYEFYRVRRGGDGDTALEMAPVLFKRSTFQLVAKGYFWLSETPEVTGSKYWGSTFPRTVTWVELVHQATGKSLTFLNTHFDYEPSAIDKSALLLKQWIIETIKNQPVIVTGDFNTDKDSFAYQQLTTGSLLLDACRQVHPNNENEGTFHGYGQTNTSIDWMLISNHFEVRNSSVDRYHEGSLYPSDHYPVTATLKWKQEEVN